MRKIYLHKRFDSFSMKILEHCINMYLIRNKYTFMMMSYIIIDKEKEV